jgi:hypothetical protein
VRVQKGADAAAREGFSGEWMCGLSDGWYPFLFEGIAHFVWS